MGDEGSNTSTIQKGKQTELWQSSTRAADDLAREALASLQRGQRPSDQVVLKALRQNVIPDGRTPS